MAEGVSAGIDGLITESSTVISEGGAKKSDVQTAYETTNDSFENPTDPHTLAYMLQVISLTKCLLVCVSLA